MVTAVDIRPSAAVSKTVDMMSWTFEDALRRGIKPPKDPGVDNKIRVHTVIPDLMETMGIYGLQRHITRSTITFNLSDLATALLERAAGAVSAGCDALRVRCMDEGHLDLLELLNKDLFVSRGWTEYGRDGTTLTVMDTCKARLGKVAEDLGLSLSTTANIAFARVWTLSSDRVARGTVDKSFLPHLDRFDEALLYHKKQLEFLAEALEGRINRSLKGMLFPQMPYGGTRSPEESLREIQTPAP